MATAATSRHVEVLTPTTGDASHVTAYGKVQPSTASFGTIAQLPLEIQVAFQQKVLAILALQLFAVGAIAGVLESVGSVETYIYKNIVLDMLMAFLLVVVVVVLLVLLYNVRNKYPLNWIMLALFSCVQVLCLLCVDVALDSHIAVVNCGFTWVVMLLMVALTRWTKPSTSEASGALHSSYTIGFIALVGACGVAATVDVAIGSIFNNSYEILLSALVQLCVVLWFCKEVKAMHQKLSPDEYMRGVIHFYTDLLVVLVVGAVCAVGGGGFEAIVLTQPLGGGGSAEEEV